MAWTGEVMRRIVGVTPNADRGGCLILFECQHEQHSNRPPGVILKWFREYPCDQCSAPGRERIKQIQASISFDDVLDKMRELPKAER